MFLKFILLFMLVEFNCFEYGAAYYSGTKTGSRHTKLNTKCVTPVVDNAESSCTRSTNEYECLLTCHEGFEFGFGSRTRRVACQNGKVYVERREYALNEPCIPVCSEPCFNGGICIGPDICYCTGGFVGPRCENSLADLQAAPNVDKMKYIVQPSTLDDSAYDQNNYTSTIPNYPTTTPHHPTTTPHHPTTTLSYKPAHPKPGVCVTWGGLHYKTFDGLVYSVNSYCREVLLRESEQKQFGVLVKHSQCAGEIQCPTEVDIYLEEKEYRLRKNDSGAVFLSSDDGDVSVPARLPGISATMTANDVIVELESQHVTIKWDTMQLVQLTVPEQLWNRTEGLCGVLDGSTDTDIIVKDRRKVANVATLANYWRANRLSEICKKEATTHDSCRGPSDKMAAKKFCERLLGQNKFQSCEKVLNVSLLMEACLLDYCRCAANNASEKCACGSVSVYAQHCIDSGIEELRAWRDEHTCPMECPPGMIYKPCGGPQPTCSLTISPDSACVEGCFCPDGQVLQHGLCMDRSMCPCRLRGRDYDNGAVVRRDCNNCTCTRGEWICGADACAGRCSAVGDPHYTTLDGRAYDFMGKCAYVLLLAGELRVNVENVACSGAISNAMNFAEHPESRDTPSCTKTVTINYSGVEIKLTQEGILVNSEPLKELPVLIKQIVVRRASSVYVIVELPNGVDVVWDGVTNVFVEVPAHLRGKTKGLCGTFNDNQPDDFLTPDGDVEQAVPAFVNKWKTPETCGDVSAGVAVDSCLLHVQNKRLAQHHCEILKSRVFEECHWHVDVTPFHEACMFDMCACEQDVGRCLCPVLAAYAYECAARGVNILWREHVEQCELECPGGQTYRTCADDCARSCSDLRHRSLHNLQQCRPRCVEGCACPPGQVLQDNGECAPVEQCSCFHDGLEFKPGFKEVRDGEDQKTLCTCNSGEWKCRTATPEDILTYPRAIDRKTTCSAADNLEFTTCEPARPVTCKNMHLPESTSTAICQPGCQCRDGYVLDATSKKCVLPVDCPCQHGGRSYPHGHVMPEDCNTCECKSGQWACTERACEGACGVWGDSHFTTFDGLNYEFEGACTYLMTSGEGDNNRFALVIKNDKCGTTGATCLHEFGLQVSAGGDPEIVHLIKSSPLPDVSTLKRIIVYEAGAFIFLDVPSLGVLVQWDKATRLTVTVDPSWKGKLRGLCGNYNRDERDDLTPSSGGYLPDTSVLTFVDSWRGAASCMPAAADRDHCEKRQFRLAWARQTCGALLNPPFSACHGEVPPAAALRRCTRDACACDSGGDCECVCVALAAYAQRCAARGVVFKWRSKDLCPCQCDEEVSAYDPCMSACPEESCDNTLFYAGIEKDCKESTCIEGCKLKSSCKSGQVYSNSSLTSCVPRSECSIPCMTLPSGRKVLEGELVEEDACHQCHCSRKQIVCTGEPCSTVPPHPTTRDVERTTESFSMVKETCRTGWSKWISNSVPNFGRQTMENEELPSLYDLTNDEGFGACEKRMMTKLECRTVSEQIDGSKPVEYEANCTIEHGLRCSGRGQPCPDFEMRVYCQCDTEPPISLPQTLQCSDTRPLLEHPQDCTKFYKCVPNSGPSAHPDLVEQTCGGQMWYNPQTMTCDWPYNVRILKPQCLKHTSTAPYIIRDQKKEKCPEGMVWSECLVECDRLCHFFSRKLTDEGICVSGQKCEAGCKKLNFTCEDGTFWRDAGKCVAERNCTCASNGGHLVKPGGIKEESECEKCQCLNNKYVCDKRNCPSSTPSVTSMLPITISPSTASTTVNITTPTSGIGSTVSSKTTNGTTPFTSTPSTYETTSSGTTSKKTTPSGPLTTPITAIPSKPTISVRPTIDMLPPLQCKERMGFSAGLPYRSVQVSSQKGKVGNLELNQPTAWQPTYDTPGEWIFFDFGAPRNITGVIIKGGQSGWLQTFIVMYAQPMKPHQRFKSWSFITNPDGSDMVFYANSDGDTPVTVAFPRTIRMRYLKLLPQSWHGTIAVRVEPIGCYEPYPEDEVLSTPPRPIALSRQDCQLCPGLTPDLSNCSCTSSGKFFDGKMCVKQVDCPCFDDHVSYAIGTSFQNANCEECMCKIGGVPDCRPKKCPPCPKDKVLKRSVCDCSCEACERGERACGSTSCVAADRWCDGVADCEDDERECARGVTAPAPEPVACPATECPAGYKSIEVNVKRRAYSRKESNDSTSIEEDSLLVLPPPRPRKPYDSYVKSKRRNNYAATKTSYPSLKPSFTSLKQKSFTLPRPLPSLVPEPKPSCPKFRCVPVLPPGHHKHKPCTLPECPKDYRLRLEKAKKGACNVFTCIPPPKSDSNCTLTGSTVTTFDGLEYAADVCDHMLARDFKEDRWKITIQNNCSLALGCGRELVITQDDDEIRMLPSLRVEYNGRPYTVDQTVAIGMETDSFFLSKNGDVLFLVSKRFFFWATYNVHGDVRIGVPAKLSSTVDGLCGYFDGSASNDLRLPDGSAAAGERFLRGWRSESSTDACGSVCPIAVQREAFELCKAVDEKTLSACSKVLDTSKWRTRCLEKVCSCQQALSGSMDVHSCLCSALQSFVVECMSKDMSVDLQGWRTDNKCPASCPAPLVHHDCYRRRCEPGCGGVANAGGGGANSEQCPRARKVCFPGCFCPEGQLRTATGCVAPQNCSDCVCDGKGSPVKYTTFERADLPFSGNCTYIAARDKNARGDYKFQVYVTNGACERLKSSVCAEALHIIYDIHQIHVQKNNMSSKFEISVDGVPMFQSVNNAWLKLMLQSNKDVSVAIPSVHLEVRTVLKNMDFTISIPSSVYANKTEGLCGNCHGTDDKLTTKNGTHTTDLQEYGLSWLVDEATLKSLSLSVQEWCRQTEPSECLPPPPEEDPCFKLLDVQAFGACHPLVNPIPHLSTCQQDLCEIGKQDGVCISLERYATECQRMGVCVNWRSKELCNYSCDGDLEYNACGLGCGVTCENYADLEAHPEHCTQHITEGCFCPRGKVLVNNTCIEHTKCFPCDSDLKHFVGDEWQTDACTHCSCFKSEEGEAVVSCVKRDCAAFECPGGQVAEEGPAEPGECCPRYACVAQSSQPAPLECKRPPKIECGLDQVATVEYDDRGCKIYTCRCLPRNQCPPLEELRAHAPGLAARVDASGCCPRARLVCDPSACPARAHPDCPVPPRPVDEGACCPEYRCVAPEGTCLVTLEWESSPEGGERRLAKPKTTLKSFGSVWWDGACRSCVCAQGVVSCAREPCPAPAPADSASLVTETRPQPYQCCPRHVHVACKHGDVVFKVGEKLTSPEDPCTTYECVSVGEDRLEKRTGTLECDTRCEPGYEYAPPVRSKESANVSCCGKCAAVACVAEGVARGVGEAWRSSDHCAVHSCVPDGGGGLRVKSESISCVNISEDIYLEYEVVSRPVSGECCPRHELTACKFNGTVYPEGSSWTEGDACEAWSCARGADGQAARVRSLRVCGPCARGFAPEPESARDRTQCCPRCLPTHCIDGDNLRPINSTWKSEDGCWSTSCDLIDGQVVISGHREACPDVSACASEHRYTRGCCQYCNLVGDAQVLSSSCKPEQVAPEETIGLLEVHLEGVEGACTNIDLIEGFTRCRGGCASYTKYNRYSGEHDPVCECCQVADLTTVYVELACPNGRKLPHQISVPKLCECRSCPSDTLEP